MSDNPALGKGARFFLVAASIIVFLAGLRVAGAILQPAVLAVLLAVISQPMMSWLRRLPLPWGKRLPHWVAVLATVAADLTLVALLAFVIGNSLRDFTQQLPGYQERFQQMWARALEWLAGHGIDISAKAVTEEISPSSFIQLVRGTAAALTMALSNLLLVFLVLVFALFEGTRLPRKLSIAFGTKAKASRGLDRIAGEIQTYLRVKTLISLITGICFGLFLWMVGVPFPALWGFLALVLNYIPNLGSIIAAIPPILLALVQFGPGAALGVTVGALAINLGLSNVVEPQFMGRSLGLSVLVVFLSVVFWGWLWGPLGVILAVPVTMIGKIFLESTDDLRWVAILLEANPKRRDTAATAEPGS